MLSVVELRSKFFDSDTNAWWKPQQICLQSHISISCIRIVVVAAEEVDKDGAPSVLTSCCSRPFKVSKCHRERITSPRRHWLWGTANQIPLQHWSRCPDISQSDVTSLVSAAGGRALCVVSLWFDYFWATCCPRWNVQLVSIHQTWRLTNNRYLIMCLTYIMPLKPCTAQKKPMLKFHQM